MERLVKEAVATGRAQTEPMPKPKQWGMERAKRRARLWEVHLARLLGQGLALLDLLDLLVRRRGLVLAHLALRHGQVRLLAHPARRRGRVRVWCLLPPLHAG